MNLNLGSFKYIVITPCKNEGKNLPRLASSVVSQSVKPLLWVIIDDGSTDETPRVIQELKKKYKWIKSIRTNGVVRDRGIHISKVLRRGYNFAEWFCRKAKIRFEYLSVIDGDMILEPKYFEKIISEFKKDIKLGIASGGLYHFKRGKLIREDVRESEPSGGEMVIRRVCFEDCGGFPVSYAWDTELNTKAKLRGWKTKRFEHVMAIETRDTGSVGGYWKGYVHKGKATYYLDFNPMYIILGSLKYSLKYPYYLGIAYSYGYFSSLAKKMEKTKDFTVRNYFFTQRPREVKKYYTEKFLNLIKKINYRNENKK